MASIDDPVAWPPRFDAPTARDRRAGSFRPYRPDPLLGRSWRLTPDTDRLADTAERAVRRLVDAPGAGGLEGLARFLLRSEAIASSRIEGLSVSPQRVALAELAAEEGLGAGGSASARMVANNITALRRAAGDLARQAQLDVEGVEALHRALSPDERQQGLRIRQNWIGGSDYHPLDADFVPPPAVCVPGLMHDLVAYASGAGQAPLVQAGITHAQFETVHPFVDGNGRVGRALIHTVLTRRGLVRVAVLPVSVVLLTRSDEYVAGLTRYRYEGAADSAAADAGLDAWLTVFLTAVLTAVEQAARFVGELAELRGQWEEAQRSSRRDRGLREAPRAGSSVSRLLDLLPEVPVLTARTVQRVLGVTFPAASNALDELAGAGVLRRRTFERATTGYLAMDVFELLTLTERRLASTRWDTRDSPPARPAPARPSAP